MIQHVFETFCTFNLKSTIALAGLLFSIGLFGVLVRRNLLIVLLSVELMLNGANITLTAFSRYFAVMQPEMAGPGQVFVMMSMAVAACEVAVGLALIMVLYRLRRTVDSRQLATLKG